MSATIKLEIEGTAEEIVEAFKTFVQQKEEVFTGDIDKHIARDAIVNAYTDRFCKFCKKELTAKQVASKSTYCSPTCGSRATIEKRLATIAAKKEKAAPKKPVGPELICLKCGKQLAKGQKKFCSKLHANQYNMQKRLGVKITKRKGPRVDKWKPSVAVVAGQGVIKGKV
jgi:ribosome-associated translation inhibitor RaiA